MINMVIIIIVIVTILITPINFTIKIIVIINIMCIITLSASLIFNKIFIANNKAIFLTTKPRFNAKRGYCIIARLAVIACEKPT